MAECYSAVVIFEGLAQELEIPNAAGLVTRGNIQRERAATLYLTLTEKPPEALRRAAARLWERLFEGPCQSCAEQQASEDEWLLRRTGKDGSAPSPCEARPSPFLRAAPPC